MFLTLRRLMLWAALAALAFAPAFTGALPAFRGARCLSGAVLLFSIYSFSFNHRPSYKRIALVILSTLLAVTAADLFTRPLVPYLIEPRPAARLVHPWPPQPQLRRYQPNVNFESTTFGDLAAMTRRAELREEHQVRFITDSRGFRNSEQTTSDNRSLDLIVLGDSFGASNQTSNEFLLAEVIAKRHQLSTYNLSVAGQSPQQEYATLLMESDRLRLRPGTTVVWLLFAGNDLDDQYFADLETGTPTAMPWRERWLQAYRNFRETSLARRWLNRSDLSNLVIERRFPDERPILFFQPHVEHSVRSAAEVRSHPNYAHLKATFMLMSQFAQEKRLRVVVAIAPSKEQVYAWVLNGAAPWTSSKSASGFAVVARELCDTSDFEFLDLEPILIDASQKVFRESGELLWWRDDTHWNIAGQRIAAEAIYDNLLHGNGNR